MDYFGFIVIMGFTDILGMAGFGMALGMVGFVPVLRFIMAVCPYRQA